MTVGSPGDKARQFKSALVQAAKLSTEPLMLPDHDLLVRYGQPTARQLDNYDDIVAVTRVSAEIDPATMGNTRSRELNLTAHVIVSVFRPGDDGDLDDVDLEKVAGDRAYELLDSLEEYVRVTDTTLAFGDTSDGGGVVRWCFCTGHESDGATAPAVLNKGRCIEIDATFTAKARVSGH
jgi:hypothetical protein